MTTYFVAAGGGDAYTISSTGFQEDGTQVLLQRPNGFVDARLSGPMSSGWTHIHGEFSGEQPAELVPCVTWYSGSTVKLQLMRDRSANGLTLHLMASNGAATEPLVVSQFAVIDVQIVSGAQGALRLYVNQALVSEVLTDTRGLLGIDRIRLEGTNSYYQMRWKSMIVATYSTLGHVVRSATLNENGDVYQWTGSWTDLRDLDDSTASSVSEPGKALTIRATSQAPAEGSVIKAVAVTAALRSASDSITGVRPIVQNAAALAAGRLPLGPAASPAPSSGLDGRVMVMDVDPDTGQPWGVTAPVAFGLRTEG